MPRVGMQAAAATDAMQGLISVADGAFNVTGVSEQLATCCWLPSVGRSPRSPLAMCSQVNFTAALSNPAANLTLFAPTDSGTLPFGP